MTLPGYVLQQDLRVDRGDTAGGRGGGLLVYSKPDVSICALDRVVPFNQYCKFKVHDVTIFLIYRPPSGGPDSIARLTELIGDVKEKSILIGDFNFPEIDWELGQTAGRTRDFLAATEDGLLEQKVEFSTHIKGNKLDLLLTNIPERIIAVEEAGRLGHSDHVMILSTISVRSQKVLNGGLQQDWSKANWEAMEQELKDWDWRAALEGKGGNEAWDGLKEKLTNLMQQHVPMKRRRNQNRPAWLSKDILRAIRKKKKLWSWAKLGEKVDQYREEEKHVRRLIRNAKKRFERKLAEGGAKDGAQKRKFYAYVKQRTKSRPAIGPLKDREGGTVSENKKMAEIFNTYFSSVFTREDTVHVPVAPQEDFRDELRDVKITAKLVKEKIRNLRQGAAGGPDKLGTQFLKQLESSVSSPLAYVMRRSLETGQVPVDWRTANVSPIFKSGAKSSPANYRPVSLTSICGKMLEAIVKDEMVRHLEINKLIRPSQHGFIRGRSCTSNLVSFLEKVTETVDGGEAVDIIYLDFAKAFDKVPTQRLLSKVRAHGIGGRLYAWIEAWLTDRRQRVVLNGEASDWAGVLSGVPQGSVLGPLLFVIFINDLDEAAAAVALLKKFADDTKLAQTIRTAQDRTQLQAALDDLMRWSEKWGMEFNVKKCKVMHVGHTNPHHSYTMGGTKLAETVEERDLGVVMTNKLKPSKQCAKAARTAQVVLGQISRAFHYKDRKVFMQLYKQYVRPHLEFAVQAWSPWTGADRDALEKVQERAVRMVSGLKSAVYGERLKELGMTTLTERRHQADMAMVHKIISRREMGEPAEWFVMAGDAPRVTRSVADPLNIRVQHGRLEIRKNFFSVRVTEPWNSVPADLKKVRSLAAFKTGYAKHRLAMVSVPDV